MASPAEIHDDFARLDLGSNLDRDRYPFEQPGTIPVSELIEGHLTPFLNDSPTRRPLKKDDQFFKRCKTIYRSVQADLGLTRQCFENMRRLACGDLSLPVILLQCPTHTQEKSYETMCEKTRTLEFIQDDLLSPLGLSLDNIVVIDIFPFLTEKKIRRMTETKKKDVTDKVFAVTHDFLETFQPSIVISCQCASSTSHSGNCFSYFKYDFSKHLGSSMSNAMNRMVKHITIKGERLHFVQAFHPGKFLRTKPYENEELKKVWLRTLRMVFDHFSSWPDWADTTILKEKSSALQGLVKDEFAATIVETLEVSPSDEEEDGEADTDTAKQNIASSSSKNLAEVVSKSEPIILKNEMHLMKKDMDKLMETIKDLELKYSQSGQAGNEESGQHVSPAPMHRSKSELTLPTPKSSLPTQDHSHPSRQPHPLFDFNLLREESQQGHTNNTPMSPTESNSFTFRHRSKTVYQFSASPPQQEPVRPRSATSSRRKSGLPVTPMGKPRTKNDFLSPAPSLIRSASSRDASSPQTLLDTSCSAFNSKILSEQSPLTKAANREGDLAYFDIGKRGAMPGAFPADDTPPASPVSATAMPPPKFNLARA